MPIVIYIVITVAIPCDYYADGRHREVKTGTQTYWKSGGTHSAIIKNPDGSQQSVNCQIYNWYSYDTFACACGNKSSNGPEYFSSTTHQYNH